MKSLYETFGNEPSYELRKGKLVQFLKNSTLEFPLPEASVEILTGMLSKTKGMDPNKVDVVTSKLQSIGFTDKTAKTLAVALIKIADQQGVHPLTYFELNEDSVKLAESTYRALNTIRPKGNLVGLTVVKSNKQSSIAKYIRP